MNGVLYLARGKKHNFPGDVTTVDEAVRSARTLREHSPDIKTAIFTDDEVPGDLFDIVKPFLNMVGDGRHQAAIEAGSFAAYCGAKLWAIRNSPFKKTLWLDTDTYILQPIDEVFEHDSHFGIAHHSRNWHTPNAGVMYVNEPFGTAYVDFWYREWAKLRGAKIDQDCMPEYPESMRVWVMPWQIWNVRPKDAVPVDLGGMPIKKRGRNKNFAQSLDDSRKILERRTERMKVSICIATFNKAKALDRTLRSIFTQGVAFPFEVIVVDDGSTDQTPKVCEKFGDLFPENFVCKRLQSPGYRNPSVARNVAYREAKGEIIIAQSDDVLHHTPNAIERLCEIPSGKFVLATVYDLQVETGKRLRELVSPDLKRPFFFLGSLRRFDMYAVGGNDEEFTAPGFDDNWFGDCLMRGLELEPVFSSGIIGYHQAHSRPKNLAELVKPSAALYKEKVRAAEAGEIPWKASGGAWQWT